MESQKNVQTVPSNGGKQFPKKSAGKKPKPKTKNNKKDKSVIVPYESASQLSGTSTYQQFLRASGKSSGGQGVNEVNMTMVDFFDVNPETAPWTVLYYDPSSLPGVFNGSPQSTRLRHVRVSVLETAINITSHAETQVGFLAGVCCGVGGFVGPDYTLCAAKQTLLLPSSTPKWRTILDANLEKLAAQGYEPTALTGQSEVGRFAMIDPDEGAQAAEAFTVQVRVELSYSCSFVLDVAANYILANANSPLIPGTGTVLNGPVFPRVTGVSNRV